MSPPQADVPTAPAEPVEIAASPWPVRVTGYFLPRPDPAWITDEAPIRMCSVGVRFAVDRPLEVTPLACPEPMPAPMVAATAAWTFAPADGAPAGSTSFRIDYVVTYAAAIASMTLYAEVDPGVERAFAGDRGAVGLKLVHPAELLSDRPVAKAHGAAAGACRLRLTVDGDGRVARSEPIACPDALQAAAAKAVARWRYRPRIEDGMTMPDLVDVNVAFR